MHSVRILILSLFSLSLIHCSGGKQAREYEAPRANYKSSRDFRQTPKELFPAARDVLEREIRSGKPFKEHIVSVSKDRQKLATDWVHSISKNHFLILNFNDKPERRKLRVRRKYTLHLNPSIHGTTAECEIEEEVEKLDKKTGKFMSWKSVKADKAEFRRILHKLQQASRQF